MYPVSAVLTAVSTKPSRPPIVWKKNSVAVRPEKKELATNPLAAGKSDSGLKCGSVRFTKPFSMRFPPTDCCPRMAIIWEMLMSDPLEPHSVMIRGALCQGSFLSASSPHFRRISPGLVWAGVMVVGLGGRSVDGNVGTYTKATCGDKTHRAPS